LRLNPCAKLNVLRRDEGASVHSEYELAVERAVNAYMLIGDVRFRRATLLARGDVVEITSALAHNLFHLDHPSATLVVRTYAEPAALPQFNYHPPHVAIDPFFRDPVLTRRVQVLELLRDTDEAAYLSAAEDLLGRCDLHIAWHVLETGAKLVGSMGFAALVQAAARRHGPAVTDRLAPSISPLLRHRRIQRLRQEVRDPSLRFFLALLLNVPYGDAILGIVAARYPSRDPRSHVERWLEALSGVDLIGIDLSDELNRTIVGALLGGLSDSAVLDRLREVFDPEDVAAQAADLADHAARIRHSVLEPLFRAASG